MHREEESFMDGDQYLPFLEHVLKPKRLEHSLQVRLVMGELAEVYGLGQKQALVAGLLHDAAKDLNEVEWLKLVAEAGIVIQHEADKDFNLSLHGPVGAYLVHKELGIEDTVILDAITSHTYYGEAVGFDAPISWCLRFSDLLEPGRDWSNVYWLKKNMPRVREAAYSGHIVEAAALQTGSLIRWFGEFGMAIHPNMYRVWAEKSAILGVDDTFLE
jgi:predicted HD superfamily hydrolase involved in NAD metabolism